MSTVNDFPSAQQYTNTALPPTIEKTLFERGRNYGPFSSQATITQSLKSAMCCTDNYYKLSDAQREALEMIAHKIGRILNGNPNYPDSWHDIAGYATLIRNDLETKPPF